MKTTLKLIVYAAIAIAAIPLAIAYIVAECVTPTLDCDPKP